MTNNDTKKRNVKHNVKQSAKTSKVLTQDKSRLK